MNYIGYILIGLIVLIGIWVYVGSKKIKWYLVYLANGDVMLLCRNLNERWWRSNGTYLRFKDERGDEVTFLTQGHWIMKMMSVEEEELEWARSEVVRLKQVNAEKVMD